MSAPGKRFYPVQKQKQKKQKKGFVSQYYQLNVITIQIDHSVCQHTHKHRISNQTNKYTHNQYTTQPKRKKIYFAKQRNKPKKLSETIHANTFFSYNSNLRTISINKHAYSVSKTKQSKIKIRIKSGSHTQKTKMITK